MSTPRDLPAALRRTSTLAVALLLVLPGTAALSAGWASAVPGVTCSAERDYDTDNGDLDGDGGSDPVIGMPNLGAVDVHLASGARRLTETELTATPSGRFGTAVTMAYVDADACGDLIVSAPGAGGVDGSVYLIPGSDTGPVPSAAVRLRAPTGAGSSWGTSVALIPTAHTLAVGAPSSPLAPNGGGAVLLYPLATDGTPGAPTLVTQGAGGIPGVSEAGDQFGATLAATRWDALAVGAPGEAVGVQSGAGAVTVLTFTGPATFAAGAFTQNSPGVPGTAETGDHFGAALAALGTFLAVGVPGETVGTATRTGVVDVLLLSPPEASGPVLLHTARQYSQDSSRVPGTNEAGDRWGTAIALGVIDEDLKVVVGAPYENIGSAADAGSVTMFGISCRCAGVRWTQGSRPVGGRAEKGDHFGWSLATLPSRDAEEDTTDSFVVGSPGEDLSGVMDAGYAHLIRNVRFGRTTVSALRPVGGPRTGLGYGSVLGAPHIRG
jgi:hypothetical protein